MLEDSVATRGGLTGRVRRGVRHQANWLQLVRFFLVGVSGYTVNLVVFALALHVAGMDYRLAACVSFVAAVTNNFVWHRRWTFKVRAGSMRSQGTRFLVVSLGSFATSLLILTLLVDVVGLPEVLSQAISLGVVAPVSFVINKFWSFSS